MSLCCRWTLGINMCLDCLQGTRKQRLLGLAQDSIACICLLRKIALEMNARYGARLGSKHHSPELDRDIAAIQDAMRVHKVFKQCPGRVLPGHVKDGEVPNVISTGLKQLQAPLVEYNKMFRTLQKRRRQTPLGPLEPSLVAATTGTTAASPSPANATPPPSDAPVVSTITRRAHAFAHDLPAAYFRCFHYHSRTRGR